jgi:hypothetical protein
MLARLEIRTGALNSLHFAKLNNKCLIGKNLQTLQTSMLIHRFLIHDYFKITNILLTHSGHFGIFSKMLLIEIYHNIFELSSLKIISGS